MNYIPINFKDKLNKFTDHWSPKIIAGMNNHHFKLVKFQGDFVWHKHDNTDEVFIVLEGKMKINFRDGNVKLKKGDMFVVPKGLEHKSFAKKECQILLVELAGAVNTGDTVGDMTEQDNVWI